MILITWVILFTIIIAYFLQTALPLFDGVDSTVGFQSVDPGFASCFHHQMNLLCFVVVVVVVVVFFLNAFCCCFFFWRGVANLSSTPQPCL